MPNPMRVPERFCDPEKIIKTLSPSDEICARTEVRAPLVMPTIEITAATPMTMPRMVSVERILFEESAQRHAHNGWDIHRSSLMVRSSRTFSL